MRATYSVRHQTLAGLADQSRRTDAVRQSVPSSCAYAARSSNVTSRATFLGLSHVSSGVNNMKLDSKLHNGLRTLQTNQPAAQGTRLARGTQRTEALFTGIVQGMATVKKVKKSGEEFLTLRIAFPTGAVDDVAIGASVAINGTCLTVTKRKNKDKCTLLFFDVIIETLRATNLGDLEAGSKVNFERSARLGDEIGGHNVSGHVNAKAVISEVTETEDNRRVVFSIPADLTKYVLPKGFISVDGCSLTVGEVEGNTFSVYLIPETLRVTVLGAKKQGDAVNIEIDAQTRAVVDTVGRYLQEGAKTKDKWVPKWAREPQAAQEATSQVAAQAIGEPIVGKARYQQ